MARDWRDSYDTVRVWRRAEVGTDPLGEPVYGWDWEDVRGVSVRSLASPEMLRGDAASSLRPDGVRAAYALAFPKGTGEGLRHAMVTFPDRGQDAETWDEARAYALAVIGDPRPQSPCVTVWDTLAEVGRTDG